MSVANLESGPSASNSSNDMGSKSSYSKFDVALEHITTVVHTLTVLFVIIIVYFVFSEDFSFFGWHPLLLSIGWVLLMTEGILSISKENVVTKWKTHAQKIRDHWYIEVVAVVLSVAGFIVIVINKSEHNRAHFTSWHGKFGLAGVVCSVIASLGGILALYNVDLRKYIKPNLNKLLHILAGTLAFTFGGISLLFLVYSSGWFSHKSGGNEFVKIFCFVILLISIVWTLIKPALSITNRIKSLR